MAYHILFLATMKAYEWMYHITYYFHHIAANSGFAFRVVWMRLVAWPLEAKRVHVSSDYGNEWWAYSWTLMGLSFLVNPRSKELSSGWNDKLLKVLTWLECSIFRWNDKLQQVYTLMLNAWIHFESQNIEPEYTHTHTHILE